MLVAGPAGSDAESVAGEERVDDEDPCDGSVTSLGARSRPVTVAESPVSVLASFRPRAGSEDALRSLLTWMVERTRAEPGCERYDLFEEREGGGALHLFERYRSAEALEAHRATAHYVEYRRRVADLLEEPIGVLVLDPIDASS